MSNKIDMEDVLDMMEDIALCFQNREEEVCERTQQWIGIKEMF